MIIDNIIITKHPNNYNLFIYQISGTERMEG